MEPVSYTHLFLLEIPAERVLGGESGKLYCIVPRDESTSLAVNHVTWESQGNGVWPGADEDLYREEYAQPVRVLSLIHIGNAFRRQQL